MKLPNDCSVSELKINPANWKSPRASMSEMWRIDYCFKDPRFIKEYPYGKRVRLKEGINRIKNVKERQVLMQYMYDEISADLLAGFNPITGVVVKDFKLKPVVGKAVNTVSLDTLFIEALRFSLTKSQNVQETIADTKSVLNSLEAAAVSLNYVTLTIGEIQTKHIKFCLDECIVLNKKFSVKRFNKAKSYLSGLYKYLVEVGAAPANMAISVNPLKTGLTERKLFTDEEIERIKDHLYTYNRPFYKFMMLFFYSGGRMKELFRLKGRDVHLDTQTYRTMVLKGGTRMVDRTIRNVAMEYWVEQMKTCGSDDYVFAKNLLPGKEPINSKQISRRWTTHVMKPLKITVTFYKLKHLNADKTLEAIGALMAAGQMGHTSTKMAETVYAANEKKRIHEGLKNVDITL